AEALRAADHDLRVVILRFGIALAVTETGRETLKRLRPFLGGRVGSGRQWVSWIHREDAIDILLRALDTPEMRGAYNATSPHPVRMRQVTDAFGRGSR
ncbi:MAG: epimerase, partial [Halomonas sp.]